MKENVIKLEELINNCKNKSIIIIEKLTEENYKDALLFFQSLIEDITLLIDELQSLARDGLFSNEISFINVVNNLFKEMCEALENKDYIYLSDLLQEEFEQYLSELYKLINHFTKS